MNTENIAKAWHKSVAKTTTMPNVWYIGAISYMEAFKVGFEIATLAKETNLTEEQIIEIFENI